MKIAVCVSNKKISAKKSVLKYFAKYLFKNNYNWAEKFAKYLDESGLVYEFLYIDENNWIEKCENFDLIIWKPAFMGVRSTQILKEKIYFMQNTMGKHVYPNYETIWHFDSKIAQSYVLKYTKIKTPETFVSFDYDNTVERLKVTKYPIIVKKSAGAGSSGVKLISSYKNALRCVNREFLWQNLFSRIVSSKLFDKYGQIYFQEFLDSNNSDLRITIIGNKYAFGFWRKNRKNDFRASGSGKIDFETDIPKEIIKYCSQISRNNNYDSMAYDILYKENDFCIIEMSYGFSESAIYKSKGYYELDKEGNVVCFNEGNYWPQEIWIKWIIDNGV
jgi:glutathione synthase/RimK-type ligase-like ATP-grasp enzyme